MTVKSWGPRSAMGLILIALVFGVDQGFKAWMLGPFDIASQGRVALTPFLDLVLAWNIGISYGLLPLSGAAGQWALAAFQIAAAIALWLWMTALDTRLPTVALSLIIGGALGNAVDRLTRGAVADFFLLHLNALGSDLTWYVFNLADVAIVAGVAVLLYESVFVRRPTVTADGRAPREE